MTTKTLQPKTHQKETNAQQVSAPPPLEVAPTPGPTAAERGWEYTGHRGDRFAFTVWIVCFLFMASLNLLDLLRVLLLP